MTDNQMHCKFSPSAVGGGGVAPPKTMVSFARSDLNLLTEEKRGLQQLKSVCLCKKKRKLNTPASWDVNRVLLCDLISSSILHTTYFSALFTHEVQMQLQHLCLPRPREQEGVRTVLMFAESHKPVFLFFFCWDMFRLSLLGPGCGHGRWILGVFGDKKLEFHDEEICWHSAAAWKGKVLTDMEKAAAVLKNT